MADFWNLFLNKQVSFYEMEEFPLVENSENQTCLAHDDWSTKMHKIREAYSMHHATKAIYIRAKSTFDYLKAARSLADLVIDASEHNYPLYFGYNDDHDRNFRIDVQWNIESIKFYL